MRDIFARLQFKTLLERLMKTAAEEGMLDGVLSVAEVGDAGAVSAPAVRTMVDEELANWLAKAAVAAPAGKRISSSNGSWASRSSSVPRASRWPWSMIPMREHSRVASSM